MKLYFPKNNILLCLLLFFWMLGILVGFTYLWDYENRPGAIGEVPKSWPEKTKIPKASSVPILLMFVHPHCPCSRASINELAVLLTSSPGKARTYVLFLKPAKFSQGWEKTDLWESVVAIPDVTPITDFEGQEANRFQAKTSGQVLLYSATGNLLFQGGITGSRGHSGDNKGRSQVEHLLSQKDTPKKNSFVFGCPLFEENLKNQKLCNDCQSTRSPHE